METRERSPLRLLAPVALAVFVIAFFSILLGAGGDGDEGPSAQSREETKQTLGQDDAASRREARRRRRQSRLASDVYVVKTGDTLGDIADKTGIPVEKLQELNTDLDPQALVSGQKIRLKE